MWEVILWVIGIFAVFGLYFLVEYLWDSFITWPFEQ